MMRNRDPISIDSFRNFSPEIVAERLQRLYSEGQPGIVFCNYWHYNDLMYGHENHLRYQNSPWMMFGRDIFGKQSLCYRISGNTIDVRRIPGQIYAGWREVPQGVVVVIRHDDIARNGINYNDHEMKKLMLQFTFKDLYLAECYLFHFVKNEAVSLFKERLQNSIETVTMVPIYGCADLLEINQEILPENEIQMMKDNAVEEFIDLFKKIMPRYLNIRLQTAEKISLPLLFLFSGGVDSLFVTMMASFMADEKYEFVLVNVSFSEDGSDFELAPDRKRGFTAYNFLKEKFPERVFHFLRADVTKDELQRERTSTIAKAISPGSSVLDDSIGCVVWFASRARGTVDGVEKEYEKATHVFVGSGSDEILGGYSRHRGRFQREGYDGLFDELRLELENIGNRNLGRDDRVALSNDRIILAPFLDEDVVRFVNQLPIQLKVDFSKPRGIGEKIVLREALKQLGCPENLYTAPKKAMQFGTRIAKLEDKTEKGTDVCARLQVADCL